MSNFILNDSNSKSDGGGSAPVEKEPGSDAPSGERPSLGEHHDFGRDEAVSAARDSADGTSVLRLGDAPALETNDKRSQQPWEHGLDRDLDESRTGDGDSLGGVRAPSGSNWDWGVGSGITGGIVLGVGTWGAAQGEVRASGKLGGGGFVGWGGIGMGAGRGPSLNFTWDRPDSPGAKPSVCGASLLIVTPIVTVQINRAQVNINSAVSQVQIGLGVTFGLGVIGGVQCSETFKLIDDAR